MIKKTILVFALFIAAKAFSQQLPQPTGLICEFLRMPQAAVITDSTPEFGWIFPQVGIRQSAYRILVASSPFLLKEGKADYWDSNKISSDQSVNVSYGGQQLKPESIYWWQVKVWSIDGLESEFSQAQQFNTGSFDRSGVEYPGQSRWIELSSNDWVSEDKQHATFHRFEPVNVIASADRYFADFGKSVIGILEFTARSTRNDSITIFLGERKNEDNTVNKDPGLSNIGFQKVMMKLTSGTHRYILQLPERGPSNYPHSQKLAPHFPEVTPFRFVEIVGNPANFEIIRIRQAGLFYYFDDDASAFRSSSEDLNAVWNLCKYTLKATPFLGVYADGNRERMPYEADAYIQQLGHYAVDREYAISKYTINFLLDHASWPTEWQMHMVLMAWQYYMYTGDSVLLKDRYEDLKNKTLIALTEENGLISTRTGKKTQEFLDEIHFNGGLRQFRDIVDWPHGRPPGSQSTATFFSPVEGGETDNYVFTDYNCVVNAFHYRALVLMGNIAKATGNMTDFEFFTERAKKHRESFLKTFFDPERGIFRDGEATDHASLHANMFPLAFGMVPAENIPTVAEFIKSRGMACSVYGAQYLLEALYQAGEADYALGLMTSDDRRSWLNMIRVGSSMTTEAWDEYFKPNLTWNHAWGSSPANIIARKMMGIEVIEPTFTKFRMAPQPGSLDSVFLRTPTIRGSISCELVNREKSWEMKISVPGNTSAQLWLPGRFSRVTINNQTVSPAQSVEFAGGERNVFELNSGIFTILANEQ